jgi:hypothetical protein
MSKDRGSNLGHFEKRISNKSKFWNYKMGIASVTAISRSHMLHYIKQCLWGAPVRIMLSLNSYMSMVALWSATRAAIPKDRGSILSRTIFVFDKLNLKSLRSLWKWKICGKQVTHDREKSGKTWPWLRRGEHRDDPELQNEYNLTF